MPDSERDVRYFAAIRRDINRLESKLSNNIIDLDDPESPKLGRKQRAQREMELSRLNSIISKPARRKITSALS